MTRNANPLSLSPVSLGLTTRLSGRLTRGEGAEAGETVHRVAGPL
jgi:hypothetical protein